MDNDTRLVQHYVLTQDPCAVEVYRFIKLHKLTCQVHLNRTRFWVPIDSPIYTEFALRFADSCPPVDPTLDLVTGHKL
jgi:hypothetical protein